MKKSAHTYRLLVTTALILFCTAIHQNLDAGFHVAFTKKEMRACKAVEKPLLEDGFIFKMLLRFVSDQPSAIGCQLSAISGE